jgi:hypothetical protein
MGPEHGPQHQGCQARSLESAVENQRGNAPKPREEGS